MCHSVVMWNNAKDKDLGIAGERVRELFDYDDDDGFLRWKIERQKVVKGKIAGYVSKSDGYHYVGFDYHELLAHRVIWLWKTGSWPTCQIDHEDRIRSNNKWKNLRQATNGQNGRNSARINKATGIRGIDIRGKKYRVRIHISGREVVVGRFISLEEAIKARQIASKEHYGEFG